MIRVVKSRLKYSLIAGGVSAIAFTVVGLITTSPAAAQALVVKSTYVSSLAFLIIPILVVVLMLNKANILTALLISEVVGIVMLFVYGYMDFSKLVAKDGLIASAFDGMLSPIIFILFIFIVVSLIRETGVLNAQSSLPM